MSRPSGSGSSGGSLGQTPAQTLGPFFHQGLVPAEDELAGPVLVTAHTPGRRLRLEGHVYDGGGVAIPDALLEIWQADHEGRYAHPLDARRGASDGGFTGFGRAATDVQGAYAFDTILPGPVRDPEGRLQAPHLNLIVGARGMARLAFGRVYFEAEEPDARALLDTDPVLARVPRERQRTLIARLSEPTATGLVYQLDIHLQGAQETVFFEF